MRLLLLLPFLTFGSYAQHNSNRILSLSAGYDFYGRYAHGWNITGNAVHQFEKVPALYAGFNLAYGISEFNSRRSETDQVLPTEIDADFSSSNFSNYNLPYYARMERVRFGVETSYRLIDESKYQFAQNHQLAVGLGLNLEVLLHYKESGVHVWTETDSTNTETIYTEDYSFSKRTEDISKPYSLYVVPHFSYTYKVNDRLGIFLRTSLFARISGYTIYGGFIQNNIGVNYRW